MRNLVTSSMKTRLVAASAAVALGAGAIAAPAAGAEEPRAAQAPLTAAVAGMSDGEQTAGGTLTAPDPNIAEQPMTPWLRILEGLIQRTCGCYLCRPVRHH